MHTTDPKAIRKAHQAADHLAKAAALLRAAADDSTWAQGKGDFLRYAIAIEELISCDNGESGLGATIQQLASDPRPQGEEAHPHGTICNGAKGRVHTIARHSSGSTYRNR